MEHERSGTQAFGVLKETIVIHSYHITCNIKNPPALRPQIFPGQLGHQICVEAAFFKSIRPPLENV